MIKENTPFIETERLFLRIVIIYVMTKKKKKGSRYNESTYF